jgi:hypothetical protein
MRCSSRTSIGCHISGDIRPVFADRLPVAGRPAGSRLPVCPAAITVVRPIGAGARSLAVGAAWSAIATEALLQVRVVVPCALSMRGIVLPAPDLGAAVDVDGSAAPVDAAAAPVAATAPVSSGRPSSKRVGCAERDAGRDQAGADITGITQ